MDNLQFLFFFITNKQKTMKKIFSLMVACAAMFAFAACEGGSDDTDKGNNGGGEKTALATPVLTVTDITSTSFVVTWEAVENAVSYMVNDGEKNNTITETSFKMENLSAGKYTVKVMAMAGEGSNYSNSEFATVSQDITGPSIDEVDWISYSASVPTDEDAQYGYYPFVHIFDSYKGTGVAKVKRGIFPADSSADTPIDQLISQCSDLPGAYIQQINGEDGLTLVYELVDSKTGAVIGNGASFRVIAQISNEAGQTVTSDTIIKTAEGTVHPDLEKWAGTWEVKTTETIIGSIDESNSVKLEKGTGEMVKTVTVSPLPEYSWNCVLIEGLCERDAELHEDPTAKLPIYGTLGAYNNIELMSSMPVAYANEEGSAFLMWMGIADTERYGIINVGGSYPAYTIGFSKSEDGVVDNNTAVSVRYEGVLGDDYSTPFETIAYIIMLYQEELLYFVEEFEDADGNATTEVWAAGDMAWTRVNAEATPSTLSVATPKNVKGIPAKYSMVVK